MVAPGPHNVIPRSQRWSEVGVHGFSGEELPGFRRSPMTRLTAASKKNGPSGPFDGQFSCCAARCSSRSSV